MAAGTARVKRGASVMTSTVTVPTTMACQLHETGSSNTSLQDAPAGAPRNFGICPSTMIRPTPLR